MLPVVSVRSACNTLPVFSVPHNMLPVVSVRSACNTLPVFSVPHNMLPVVSAVLHVTCCLFFQFRITYCLLFQPVPHNMLPVVQYCTPTSSIPLVHAQAQIQGVPRFWTVSDKVTRNL